jgi:hypothetical protein
MSSGVLIHRRRIFALGGAAFLLAISSLSRISALAPLSSRSENKHRIGHVQTAIQDSIENLNNDDYQIRERATQFLASTGAAVIEPIARAVINAAAENDDSPKAGRETIWRGVEVLRRVAFDYQPRARAGAVAMLDAWKNHSSPTLSRLATTALLDYESKLSRAAVKTLRDCKVSVYRHEKRHGVVIHTAYIGPGFAGTDVDVKHLARLESLNELVLGQPRISVAALRFLQHHPRLKRITLRGSSLYTGQDQPAMTVATLTLLTTFNNLPALESVTLDQCDVSDQLVQQLKQMLGHVDFKVIAR